MKRIKGKEISSIKAIVVRPEIPQKILNISLETMPSEKKFKHLSEDEKLAIREEEGLDYRLLCRTIVGGLNAETVIVDSNGKEAGRIPSKERASWIEPGMKMVGVKVEGGGDINFNLTVGERSEIKARILKAVHGSVGVGVIINGS